MKAVWSRSVAGALLAAITLLTVQDADAAPRRSITLHGTSIRDERLQTTVDGVSLPADRITVTVNGRRVPATGRQSASAAAIIVVDTSASMAGDRLQNAVRAGRDFLADLPANTRVGVLAVATSARLQVAPTTDRSAVVRGLKRLRAGGSTALYDGIAHALTLAPTGEILVVSDGSDTTSRLDLQSLLAAEAGGTATVDVVGLQRVSDRRAGAVQSRIAAAGHGRTYAVESAASAAADRFSQVRISATVASPLLRPETTVSVTVTGPAGAARASTTVAIPVAPQAGGSGSRLPLLLGIGAVGVGAAVLLFLGLDVPGTARRRRRMYDAVARYGAPHRSRATPAAISGRALDLAGRLARRGGLDRRLATRLDAAGIPMQPNEWLLVCVSVAVSAGALVALLAGNVLTGLLVGLLIGAGAPFGVLVVKAGRRRRQFTADLPDALTMMSGSLTSGYSLPQAVDSVVRLGQGVVAVEFGRALAQSRLGMPVEDALEAVADRMDAADLHWVVMAIRIQRRVGGNLAEILLQVAETIRERGWLRRHVSGLSAEGRLSAAILGMLPVVIGAYMFLVRRSYIRPLYTHPAGLLMLGCSALLLAAGVLWMRRLVKVEL